VQGILSEDGEACLDEEEWHRIVAVYLNGTPNNANDDRNWTDLEKKKLQT